MFLRNAFPCILKVRKIYRNFEYRLRYFSKTSVEDHFKIHVIPALSDNFMYVLIDKQLNSAVAVDPVEPDKIFRILETEKSNLTSVLTTHHHLDHAGGNEIISKQFKYIPIYGGDERIKAMTNKLSHNEIINFGTLSIRCLYTPCHTSGHVCYFTEAKNLGSICFTGDTLFVGGCGRFFEGSAEHMLKSLNLLSLLPPETKIFCGHEYTLSNLKFALSVEPNNQDAIKKLKHIEDLISKGKPSVPSTIKEELSYNPFLRTSEENVQKYAKENDPVVVMRILRERKDNF